MAEKITRSEWRAVHAVHLLPPPPDCCQVCAVDHAPHEPHNPESLYWATARHMAGESPPTWDLALEHVADELRAAWVALLATHGVEVAPR